MKYDNLRAFEKHLIGASPHHFSSLYLVLGKEYVEVQEAIRLLLHFLLPPPQKRELALSILDGAQLEEKALKMEFYSLSFFTKQRVILIQQTEKLHPPLQKYLEHYFLQPISGLFLLLSGTGWQKNTSFYRAAEKGGIVLEFVEVKSWEKEKRLAEWINQKVSQQRKLIAYPLCQILVKQVGGDQALLAQELEKLMCYCEDKKEITLEDIEAICTYQPVDSIWSLGEAIFRRDSEGAWQKAHALFMEGLTLIPLVRQLRTQLQIEYQVALLLEQGKQPQEITQEFPYMKGAVLEKHLQQARQYGLQSFKQGLLALDAAEQRLKNSSIDEKRLIERLIIELTKSHG